MKREIKFRAWDEEAQTILQPGEFDIMQDGNGLVATRNHFDGRIAEVKPLQYTGLKAIRNIEIYEGDIVRQKDEVFEVVWLENVAQFRLYRKSYAIDIETCEVVGNIYENPELISYPPHNDEK